MDRPVVKAISQKRIKAKIRAWVEWMDSMDCSLAGIRMTIHILCEQIVARDVVIDKLWDEIHRLRSQLDLDFPYGI